MTYSPAFMARMALAMLLSVSLGSAFSQELQLHSPSGDLWIKIITQGDPAFSLHHRDGTILKHCRISLETDRGRFPASFHAGEVRYNRSATDRIIMPEIPGKSSIIKEQFNELQLASARKDWAITFRLFDNGMAYRFETFLGDSLFVKDETMVLEFEGDPWVYFPEEKNFFSHNERSYEYLKLSGIGADRFCSLPVLFVPEQGAKVLLTESDLSDYPGMWLSGAADAAAEAVFPGYPAETEQTSDRDLKVTRYADHIAKTRGTRTFPWRVFVVAEKDADLLTSQLVWLLAPPCAIDDPSWIRPGKAAWDWWNALNLYGVEFFAGVNTETYKYFIDFAASHDIEYIIMDEGWYKLGNLLELAPGINMEEILAYARERNVGVILWVVWKTLEEQWEEAFEQFARWGVAGLKVDFMQRDDQWMVNFYHRVAAEAARHQMIVDFHGAYKPCGLRRTWPNVLTREGVRGLEHSKWSDAITTNHNVTIPFIRMVAGPMDYTPGAMLNANPAQFHPVFNRPMSQGTRCHQLAMYVVYESPLQMLADSPSNYEREKDCMDFLSAVPTVWDTTIILSAAVARHVALARKKGNEWYVGAMTGSGDLDLILSLSFLEEGASWTMFSYEDGPNAVNYAGDFLRKKHPVGPLTRLNVHMAPGGGWVARITKAGK
ncbi:MAG: glycoside hydrolase family 97 protein [Bacteroidales bacterium]|nr:glycoside hydrolase family 97 protein [Bacteroidales bacterium]